MKNIYIIGVPRTGKSTLSKMIKLKYPSMNLISFEAVRNGFIKSQPNLDMGNRKSDARQNILPQFLVEFVYWNNIITGYGNIVEGSFSNVDTIKKLINGEDIVICLGLGKRKIETIIEEMRKHDKENDYTKNWTDEQIKKHFYDITEKDRENDEPSQKLDIEYFDTFQNREEVFSNILEYLDKKLKNN